ncbi:hypothetical protein [Rhodococcus triatomae]|uniref:hypothetical protein n=1 Tax=Rhodococcus triatomae TaxID=300028 RepID=UPI001628A9FE|nr:hypothetical protein [Rhodococcus triatomae]QNG19851.1 hypothetical protein G4H72_14980 [Rhodococcus triatomae]
MNKYLAAAATTTAAVCATIATVGSAAASPTFGDGTYLVGTDIAPGQYAGSGQVDEHMGCYWERRSGTSGNFDEILANDYTHSGRVVVTILPSDYAFRSEDCGTWTRIGDVPAPRLHRPGHRFRCRRERRRRQFGPAPRGGFAPHRFRRGVLSLSGCPAQVGRPEWSSTSVPAVQAMRDAFEAGGDAYADQDSAVNAAINAIAGEISR